MRPARASGRPARATFDLADAANTDARAAVLWASRMVVARDRGQRARDTNAADAAHADAVLEVARVRRGATAAFFATHTGRRHAVAAVTEGVTVAAIVRRARAAGFARRACHVAQAIAGPCHQHENGKKQSTTHASPQGPKPSSRSRARARIRARIAASITRLARKNRGQRHDRAKRAARCR